MTLFFHEMKRDIVRLAVWTTAVAFMLCVSVIIYPQISSQMNDIGGMFSDMGSFSSAFGMDRVNFGEFSGYFAVECGNVLGLGGAFFAALAGITALSKEERERTAEFLLTHPVSRTYVVAQKFFALLAQILIFNTVVALSSLLSAALIGQSLETGLFLRIFSGYLLMQIEIACIMFGVSAAVRGNGIGIALGTAFVLYFMNILANLTEDAKFLKYITPFSYADGTEIVSSGKIELSYLLPGIAFALCGAVAAFVIYRRKDISA